MACPSLAPDEEFITGEIVQTIPNGYLFRMFGMADPVFILGGQIIPQNHNGRYTTIIRKKKGVEVSGVVPK